MEYLKKMRDSLKNLIGAKVRKLKEDGRSEQIPLAYHNETYHSEPEYPNSRYGNPALKEINSQSSAEDIHNWGRILIEIEERKRNKQNMEFMEEERFYPKQENQNKEFESSEIKLEIKSPKDKLKRIRNELHKKGCLLKDIFNDMGDDNLINVRVRYSQYANGKCVPSYEWVIKLCDALHMRGIDIDESLFSYQTRGNNKPYGDAFSFGRIIGINDLDEGELPEMDLEAISASMDEDIREESLESELKRSLSLLSPRERKIIEGYFGLEKITTLSKNEKIITYKPSKSLEEMGEEFHLTRERVRQIKMKAIRRLRHLSRSRGLRQYL